MTLQDRYPRAHFIDQSKRDMTFIGRPTGVCLIAENAALDTATIDYTGGVTIEEGVHFGRDVMILSCSHPVQEHDGLKRRNILSCTEIMIQKNAYIGSRATILQGVTIGESAYIAAGAVVTKNIEPFTLVGGVPAKVLPFL